MPLINTRVPNLIQGVSQQPDATRFDGQCEEQVNALSSVAEGLKKRPNTRHIAKLLDTAIDANSFVHFINRDANEKYVLINNGTHLYAHSMITGAESEIKVGNNCYKSTWTAAEVAANPTYVATGYPVAGTYLASNTARASLKALTLSDSTYIINSDISVARGSITSPTISNDSLVFVKQGDYEKKYGFDITLNSTSGSNADITLLSRYLGYGGKYTMDTITVPSGGTGSGFSVGDIINVPLPLSKTIEYTDNNDEDIDDLTTTAPLILYTQPTIKVLSTGTDGKIITAAIENSGVFRYVTYTNDGGYVYCGTGNRHNSYATSNFPEVYGFLSTNTTVTENSGAGITITKQFKSGDDAEDADTTNILTGISALGSTSSSHAGTSSTWSQYFETDTTKLSSNLLILKSKKDANGDDVVVTYGITARDGLGGDGIGIVYKEVSSISDLPIIAPNGFTVKVAGDAELNQDDYYVEFKTTGNEDIGKGAWVECVAPNLPLGYDSSTLPIEILSDGLGFTLRPMKLANRVSGDDKSNPLSSFVAQSITNLFFFKNRLGFLSGENISMSESGLGVADTTGQLEFNFGRNTVTALLDSDPIDVSVASSRVTNLKAAKGFQENLVLFSETGQFVMKGGDVLTPSTVSITPITNFSFEDQVDPLPLGSYIYFPFTRGAFTGMREFTVNASTDVYESAEITEHVPAYIPKNIIDMAGTTSEDIIVLLSGDEKGSLYIYNYFWNNNQKVLSAWSKFTFTGEIRGIEFIESDLFLVVASEGKTQLLNMPLNSGQVSADDFVSESSVDFGQLNVLLDERIEVRRLANTDTLQVKKADGSWSSSAADFPYSTSDATKYKFVTAAGETHVVGYNTNGFFLNDAGITPFYQINIYGYLGRPYDMEYKFSTQLFKASSGKSASPSAASAMTIRNGAVFFDETSEFTVKVTPEGRPMASNVFLASSRPDAETYNGVKFSEGFFRFPVYSKAKHANITLQNSSPFDCKFSSAEFESFVHPRSNRYG